MPFNFETFDKRQGRLVKVPEVSIQSSGSVSLNAAAAHLIGEPEAVEMLYDRDQRVIGVRGVEPEAAHAYQMRGIKNRASFIVNCKAFFLYYDIPLGESIRREVTVEDGVLIVNLNDKGRVVMTGKGRGKNKHAESNGTTHEDAFPALAEAGSGGRLVQ